jgi:hypothetical protein
MIRKGEFHEGEVIEALGESFRSCHFVDCILVGAAHYDDCSFTNCEHKWSPEGDWAFRYCVFKNDRKPQIGESDGDV